MSTDSTSSEKHWSKTREYGSYASLQIVAFIFNVLGRAGLIVILYPIVIWYFLISYSARKASMHYLHRVYNSEKDTALARPPNNYDSFLHFLSFGEAIADRMAAWGGKINRTDIIFDQRHMLYECQKSGRGAVIFTSHLGNADMSRGLINNATDIKVNVLIYQENAEYINAAMKRINPELNVNLISINAIHPGTIAMLDEKISGGEFVIIAADRTPANNPNKSISATFFNRQAQFPQGAFILASLLDCQVFLLFCLKDNRHRIYFEKFADRIEMAKDDRINSLQPYVQRYADRLEYYCCKAPLQWFNFYDFWASKETHNKYSS